MNDVAEKLSIWFGSTPFILMHVIWFALWYPLGGTTDMLTLIVSLEAIFLALFILRAENVQSKRMEQDVKEDVAKSDQVIGMLEEDHQR